MSTIINDEFSGNAATATTATTAGSVDANNLTGTTLAAGVVNSSLTNFGTVDNITMTDTGAIRTTTTSGQSVYFSAYDNDGATYVPMMYMTAGNTPSLTISNGVGEGTLSVTGATIGAVSMTVGTGGFITLGTGDAVRTTTTLGETWLMQAYDTDNSTYRTFGTFTAGTTPSMALSAPAGGSATIDNITIGGTTRAAGSFSTIGIGKTATANSIDTLANNDDLATIYYNLQPASGNGLLQIKSGTGTGFVPSLFGTGDDSNDFGLNLVGQCTPGNDTGATAVIRIDGRQNDGTTLDTRPILAITNLAVNRLTVAADGALSTIGNITSTTSTAGTNQTITVSNTNNSNASSSATYSATVGGASAGDPSIQYVITGATTFSGGLDNSDSDKFKEQFSATVGTSPTRVITTAGEMTMPLQPAFAANKSGNTANVTGDGTTYTLICDTEIFDQNADYNNATGVFTAPVTGRYHFCFGVGIFGLLSTHTQGYMELVTSNRTYRTPELSPYAASNSTASLGLNGSIFADMDAADTASITITVANGTLVVDVDGGGAPIRTYFQGYLEC